MLVVPAECRVLSPRNVGVSAARSGLANVYAGIGPAVIVAATRLASNTTWRVNAIIMDYVMALHLRCCCAGQHAIIPAPCHPVVALPGKLIVLLPNAARPPERNANPIAVRLRSIVSGCIAAFINHNVPRLHAQVFIVRKDLFVIRAVVYCIKEV